jgi:hypothetical protein
MADLSKTQFDFIVYMNKTHQVYLADAMKYIREKNMILQEDDHNQVISETVFQCYIQEETEYIEGKSFYFITKCYPEFDEGFKRFPSR